MTGCTLWIFVESVPPIWERKYGGIIILITEIQRTSVRELTSENDFWRLDYIG